MFERLLAWRESYESKRGVLQVLRDCVLRFFWGLSEEERRLATSFYYEDGFDELERRANYGQEEKK